MKVTTIEEMRECDRRAIEAYGMRDTILMENAGNSMYFAIMKHIGRLEDKRFVVFVGSGNNGGDALVVARKLNSMSASLKIYLLTSDEKFRGSARNNYEIVSRLNIPLSPFNKKDAADDVLKADAVIDGMIGTGISRDIGGAYKEAVDLINRYAKLVFSIDVPSGINGNTGMVMGTAVKSDVTVTFGLPKRGNVLYPGYEYCGKLYVSHISFPPEIYNDESIKVQINEPIALPLRKKDGHKGTFGDALFVAGARKYYGAPYFSSLSFLKSGGGYSRLATPLSVTPFIGAEGREIVFHPLPETDEGSIASSGKEDILKISDIVDIVVLGLGTSLNEETQNLITELVENIPKPLLLDGDGLTAVSKRLEVLRNRKAPTILTPHLGEMARLTGKSIGEVAKNRIPIGREFAIQYGVYLVLKGAHTQIATPEGKVFINMTGNPGMATAGSGDVLTGTIAAMYGLGFGIEEAVRMGVFVHGLAGDMASEAKGEDGITARDIMENLPLSMKSLREDFERIRKRYGIELI